MELDEADEMVDSNHLIYYILTIFMVPREGIPNGN